MGICGTAGPHIPIPDPKRSGLFVFAAWAQTLKPAEAKDSTLKRFQFTIESRFYQDTRSYPPNPPSGGEGGLPKYLGQNRKQDTCLPP